MKNKILSMMLCASLIFTMLAQPQIQPPAHAEAVTLTVSAVAVVLTILAACGITFASTDVAKKCIQQFAADVPDVPTLVSDILGSTPQGHILSITAVTLPKVKQLVSKAIGYFKGKTGVAVASDLYYDYQGVKILKSLNITDYSDKYYKEIYDISPYYDTTTSSAATMTVNGVTYSYGFFTYVDDGEAKMVFGVNHDISLPHIDAFTPEQAESLGFSLVNYRFGFYLQTINNKLYIQPYTSSRRVKIDGTVSYIRQTVTLYEAGLSFPLYAEEVTSLPDATDSASVDTININNPDDINEAIAHSVGKSAEGIQADIQSVIDAINAATATDVIGIDAARELLGIKDELKELEREQERIEDAIKEGTKEDDMDVPKLPATITDKFPFCVPFDLIALVKTFSATPEAPKVTVPVVFDSMHYSHDFVFDFSGDNWDKVAAVIRWGTLIFFILGLTLVTRKLIKG